MSLRLSHVSKTIGEGVSAFQLQADFEVLPGERIAIVARSGGGKTSLLRLIAGLDPLDAGEISLSGHEITQMPTRLRQIGFIFQDSALFPGLNVLENTVFGLRARGRSQAESHRLGLEALERVGMRSQAGASILNLSGGEKQRVAFLRATLWGPKLLLLDEPFSALDAAAKNLLRADLLSWLKLIPVPLLFVTHEALEVDALATAQIHLKEDSSGVRHFER